MKKKDVPVTYTPDQVKSMINARDFSAVEGDVPDLISFLLKSSPDLLKSALDVALQNQKILQETQEYIRRTSDKVLKEYTAVAKLEQQSLADTNKALNSVLVSLAQKEQMSADDADIYFRTLQEIERNNVRMGENRKESAQFLEKVQDRQITNAQFTNAQAKGHIVAKAVINTLQSPQGSKMVAEALILLARSLYKAYTK